MDDSMSENVENFIADAQAEADPTPVDLGQSPVDLGQSQVDLGQSVEETNGVLADTSIKTENDKASLNGQNHAVGKVYPYDDFSANDYSEDETYKKIIAGGVAPIVAAELMEALKDGVFQSECIEDRTIEFVKNIAADHARFVLCQFRKSNIIGIGNPSAYLGSLIKNFKERIRVMGVDTALTLPVVFSPPIENLQAVLNKKGYKLEVTIGQRKYGGPPPNHEGPVPGAGCEVYVGKIPKEVFEDELIPLFEECGDLYDFRLMMDPLTGMSKGYGFATFMAKADSTKASTKYDGYEIKPGKKLRCNVSIANTRLFVGNIPKSKGKEEIMEEFSNSSEMEGLIDAIVYPSAEDPQRRRNRGFCFLEFSEHKFASAAKRRLASGRMKPFNCDVYVDWAEPQDEIDEQTMSQVKALYVKTLREVHTEEMVKEEFAKFGELEKIKKIKDYCFVHYANRDDALKAMEALNNKEFHGITLDVSLARPQTDRKKQTRNFRGFGRGMGQSPFGGGMYGGPMADPYHQGGYGGGDFGYGGGYGGGYNNEPYSFGGGSYGGGYSDFSSGFSPASSFGSQMSGNSRGRAGFGGVPRGRGGGPRGGYGSLMSFGGSRGGGSPAGMRGGGGYPRGGAGFGNGYRGGAGGVPAKRPFTGGASNSPKRQNNNFSA